MKNKHGFSMVELLAVIVILGAISTIGIVAVRGVIGTSKTTYYNNQGEMMVAAAQSYVSQNRSLLPKELGGKKEIKLQKLIDEGYIEGDIKDKEDGTCNPNESFVRIVKKSKSDYVYKAHLSCPSCKGQCIEENADETPFAKFHWIEQDKNEREVMTGLNVELFGAEKNAQKNLTSYSYKVYKDGIIVSQGPSKRLTGSSQTVPIDISAYTPGDIKVQVSVTNEDGVTKAYTEIHKFELNGTPFCGAITNQGELVKKGTTTTCKDWKLEREIYVACDSIKGFQCARPTFSKTINKDSIVDDVIVYDIKNKANKCSVYSCVDTTNPYIEVKVYKIDKDKKETLFKTNKQNLAAGVFDLGDIPMSTTFGLKLEVTYTDSISLVKDASCKANPAKLTSANMGTLTTAKSETDLYKKSHTYTYQIKESDYGYRNIQFTVTDGSGKTSNTTVKFDLKRIKCEAGTYLKTKALSCATCTANSYCVGGDFTPSYTSDQGILDCPSTHSLSAAGAKAKTNCYRSVEAGKYYNETSDVACAANTYKAAHSINFGSTDSCDSCPEGYRDGTATGMTTKTQCNKKVPAANRVATAEGSATSCGTGYYKAEHNVKFGSTSTCTQCPDGYRDGAAVGTESGCAKSVSAGNKVATAKGSATSCGKGYYRAAHSVTYGDTSSCTQCPEGYRDGAAADAKSSCIKNVAAGNKVATANGDATSCGNGYYKEAHDVSFGNTSSCTQCPDGYRDGAAVGAESECKKSVSAGYKVATEKGAATKCAVGSYKTSHEVKYGKKSSCTSCPSGQTTDSKGSTSSSDCHTSCGISVNSYYPGDTSLGGLNYVQYTAMIATGGCTITSAKMCYYNSWSGKTSGCKSYSSGGGNGYGYIEFFSTEARYWRYTDYGYGEICISDGQCWSGTYKY